MIVDHPFDIELPGAVSVGGTMIIDDGRCQGVTLLDNTVLERGAVAWECYILTKRGTYERADGWMDHLWRAMVTPLDAIARRAWDERPDPRREAAETAGCRRLHIATGG